MVKEFLSQQGVPFEERDVSVDRAAAQELQSRTGRMAVPVILADGQTVIGFDRPKLEQALSQFHHEPRPVFGATIADASKFTARPGAEKATGAYVGSITPGSAAEKLGLASGDIVTEVNMQRIENAADLENVLSGLTGGSRLSVLFIRDSQKHKAEGPL
ncbi:MAG: glutaredoxin domain-containing protein [Chloroflexota bacterium]